jgi:hypothetical protein
MLHGCAGAFPGEEGRMQVLEGLAPSNQMLGSLLRTPDQKILAKREIGKFTSLQHLTMFDQMD